MKYLSLLSLSFFMISCAHQNKVTNAQQSKKRIPAQESRVDRSQQYFFDNLTDNYGGIVKHIYYQFSRMSNSTPQSMYDIHKKDCNLLAKNHESSGKKVSSSTVAVIGFEPAEAGIYLEETFELKTTCSIIQSK